MATFVALNSSRPREEAFFERGPEHMMPAPSAPLPPPPPPRSMMPVHAPAATAFPDDSTLRTPTRDSFGAAATTTTNLDHAPHPRSHPHAHPPPEAAFRMGAHDDAPDVDMNISSDEETGAPSDDEAEDADGAGPPSKRSKKKKKGQRFYCRDFPPCRLSFTRSEHLARHIRKHTGERPFQCHCARRFSRLDNLRQHAQTVHVNEDIPIDSLAATGTRFQRQVRTDRVRPTSASRARANTLSGAPAGGPVRGHARNLSASSVASSTTTASSLVYRDEGHRSRPSSLAMTAEGPVRPGLSLDTFRSPPDSPGGYSTPTSATFSTGPASPRFSGSGLRSPGGPVGPPGAFWGSRTPGRRLSVPSGGTPLASPVMHQYPPSAFGPTSPFSGRSSTVGSPTSSVFSIGPWGHEPMMPSMDARAAPDVGLKRRTWHPGTTRHTFTSPLANNHTTTTTTTSAAAAAAAPAPEPARPP